MVGLKRASPQLAGCRMILSRGRKYVFIHIPKTGGTSLALSLEGKAMADDIMQFCLTQMAYYKAPGHIAFVDELPLTSTQKIQRGVLKTLVADLAGSPDTLATGHLKKRQTT